MAAVNRPAVADASLAVKVAETPLGAPSTPVTASVAARRSRTVVLTEAWLFWRSGSKVSLVTLAPLVMTVPAGTDRATRTSTWTVVPAPAGSAAMLQVTTVVPPQVAVGPAIEVAPTRLSPAGRVSVSTTLFAVPGPA